MATPQEPRRSIKTKQDNGMIDAIKYNDASGADKVIIVEPVVIRAVGSAENIGAGKLVKVTGTAYTLDLVGRAYSASSTYQKGDIATNTTFIYMALQDDITGTFDASKWKKVATKTVGPVTIVAGAVVSTGRWHNTVTEVGFLVDDQSFIAHTRHRD